MTGFGVWSIALQQAASGWDDQAEGLTAARSSLSHANTSLLGKNVGKVAEGFIEKWRRQIMDQVAEAEGHADKLRSSSSLYTGADESSADALRKLLPWDQRSLPSTDFPMYGPGMP